MASSNPTTVRSKTNSSGLDSRSLAPVKKHLLPGLQILTINEKTAQMISKAPSGNRENGLSRLSNWETDKQLLALRVSWNRNHSSRPQNSNSWAVSHLLFPEFSVFS